MDLPTGDGGYRTYRVERFSQQDLEDFKLKHKDKECSDER